MFDGLDSLISRRKPPWHPIPCWDSSKKVSDRRWTASATPYAVRTDNLTSSSQKWQHRITDLVDRAAPYSGGRGC